jgi:TRAP transporter TAXI family solute receptor
MPSNASLSSRLQASARARPTVVVAALAITVALVGATMALRPGAPRHVAIATGGAATTFYRSGRAYQEILLRSGVHLELESESSTADNVRRLEDRRADVDVAIVHGGTLETEVEGDDADDPDAIQRRHPELVTLGTLFCEPLWIFHRLPGEPSTLNALLGKRIGVGRKGSVTHNLVRLVLKTGGIPLSAVTLVELRGTDAPAALARGEVDAVIVSAPIEAKPVQELWRTPGVHLMGLSQAEAYTRRLPWLGQVTLPAGGLDIAGNLPPHDVKLLASGASLVVRRSLHPGIVYLLLTAATQVHAGANAFQRYGEFPSLAYADLPVHDSARRYFKEGPSLLYRHLPFWLASILDRIGVVLPAIALVLSIARYAPPALDWLVRNRINRCYGELRYLEDELDRAPAGADVAPFAARLAAMEARVAGLSAPLSASDRIYTLKSHVLFVRDKLAARSRAAAGAR